MGFKNIPPKGYSSSVGLDNAMTISG